MASNCRFERARGDISPDGSGMAYDRLLRAVEVVGAMLFRRSRSTTGCATDSSAATERADDADRCGSATASISVPTETAGQPVCFQHRRARSRRRRSTTIIRSVGEGGRGRIIRTGRLSPLLDPAAGTSQLTLAAASDLRGRGPGAGSGFAARRNMSGARAAFEFGGS
jgi:hypothetical protein